MITIFPDFSANRLFVSALFQTSSWLFKGALNRLCAQAQFNLSCLKVDCKTQDILGTSWPEEN